MCPERRRLLSRLDRETGPELEAQSHVTGGKRYGAAEIGRIRRDSIYLFALPKAPSHAGVARKSPLTEGWLKLARLAKRSTFQSFTQRPTPLGALSPSQSFGFE